jgi:uncharacterized membrane protein
MDRRFAEGVAMLGSSGNATGRQRLAILVVALAAAAFVAGTWITPLLIEADHPAGSWLHWAYSPLCHQQPDRSLVVVSGQQSVCARCAGLYVGGVLGLLAGALLLGALGSRLRPILFFAATAPTAVDALLPWIGLPGLPNVPRLLLAIPAGLAAGLFLALGIADLASSKSSDRLIPRALATDTTLEVLDG